MQMKGFSMKAIDYYLGKVQDLAAFDFKRVNSFSLNRLPPLAVVGLPEQNTVAFDAQNSLTQMGARRISPCGKWLQIASLQGAIEISTENLDIRKPIGLVFCQGENFYSCVYTFDQTWRGFSFDDQVRMTAKPLDSGHWIPRFNLISTRGEYKKNKECLVWLPAPILKIESGAQKTFIETSLGIFEVDARAKQSIDEGWVKWVLPNDNGWFEILKN